MISSLLKSKGLGRLGFNFRVPSGLCAAVLIIIHQVDNAIPFNWVDYFTIFTVLTIPYVYLIWYVKSGEDKGLAFRQIKYDLFLCGFISGCWEISLVPTVIYCLAILTTYINARGFAKIYRVVLIPMGAATSLTLQGSEIHLASTDLMNYCCVTYAVMHFIILSIASYGFAKKQLEGKEIIEKQSHEINTRNTELHKQAVQLNELNNSLNKMNNELEVKVTERTQELVLKNDQLTNYSFVNAHKLRAPVATLLGLLHLYYNSNLSTQEKQEVIIKIREMGPLLKDVVGEIQNSIRTDPNFINFFNGSKSA